MDLCSGSPFGDPLPLVDCGPLLGLPLHAAAAATAADHHHDHQQQQQQDMQEMQGDLDKLEIPPAVLVDSFGKKLEVTPDYPQEPGPEQELHVTADLARLQRWAQLSCGEESGYKKRRFSGSGRDITV